jgi:hypothetical protein
MREQTSPSATGGRGQSTADRTHLTVDDELAEGSISTGEVIEMRARRQAGRGIRRVRIRVNARGAEYVAGLQAGRVYDAKIKQRWPDTVWPEGTGLSHTCFLLEGMYEFVTDAGDDDSYRLPPHR